MTPDIFVKKWFVVQKNGEFPDSDPNVMRSDLDSILVKGRLKYLGVFHDKDDAINRVAREGMKVCGKLSPYCFAHPQVTK